MEIGILEYQNLVGTIILNKTNKSFLNHFKSLERITEGITFLNVKQTAMFVKNDALTEHLTLFWFVLLINKCKPEFRDSKEVREMRNLDNVYICGSPLLREVCKRLERCLKFIANFLICIILYI